MPKVDAPKSWGFDKLRDAKIKKQSGKKVSNTGSFDDALYANRVSLETEQESLTDEQVMKMFRNVDELGKKLSKNVSEKNIKEYSKAVKKFITYILENAYEVDEIRIKKRSSLASFGKKEKLGTLVSIANNELDNLARCLISQEINNFYVLEKIDKIKGLIIDCIS